MSEREFKILTDVEHVLLRPNMYIGGINLTENEQWIYDKESGKFSYGTVKYVPAVIKCASELIDNSIDVAIDTNFEKATRIQVRVDDKSIEVVDNGIGIPCEPPKNKPGETRTCAEIAWTTLKSGTSFGENRNKIGTNGVGSSCVNVFSSLFIGESDDGIRRQTITCRKNLSEINAGRILKSSGKSGVRVYCEPDLKRFNLEKIDDVHKNLIYQRLINLAISYPKIRFSFNGEKISVNEKKFSSMFSENCVVESGDNFMVCVFPNESDEFRHFTYVNGIDMRKGGTHIDYLSYELTSRVRDKLIKKYKSIRPADIKNKISLVAFFTDFANPEFDSQTKESLSNSQGDITRHLNGKLDFDKMAKAMLKNDAIIGPVVDTFKLKEELKARQELKQTKKTKIRSDKYFPGIGEKKYLFLVEGLSAGGGLMKCLGRDGKYFFCLRGLALNAFSASLQKIAANQEIKDVLNIIGLDLTNKTDQHVINFDRIVIATDADVDGINITSMLLGWWYRLCPDLYSQGKICKLNTPIVIVKDQKDNIRKWFFTLDEFKSWEKTNTDNKLKIVYLKGLGSLSTSDLDYIIQQQGFDSLLEEYVLDENSKEYFENWLGDDSEPRKKYITDFSLDINRI